MITTDWRSLGPGFELEAIAAVKVLGWTWQVHVDCATLWRSQTEKMLVRRGENFEEAHWWSGGELYGMRMPQFSREIEAAWMLVDGLWSRHQVHLWRLGQEDMAGRWKCSVGQNLGLGVDMDGDTPMMAICRAAIAAVEYLEKIK